VITSGQSPERVIALVDCGGLHLQKNENYGDVYEDYIWEALGRSLGGEVI